jgi:hypothetical protein
MKATLRKTEPAVGGYRDLKRVRHRNVVGKLINFRGLVYPAPGTDAFCHDHSSILILAVLMILEVSA